MIAASAPQTSPADRAVAAIRRRGEAGSGRDRIRAATLPLAALLLLALPTAAGAQSVSNERVLEDTPYLSPQSRVRVMPPPRSTDDIECRIVPAAAGGIRQAEIGRNGDVQAGGTTFRLGDGVTEPDGSILFGLIVRPDDIVEANEVFRVACTISGGNAFDPFYGGFVTILDNDVATASVAPVLPFPGPGGQTVREEAGPVQFEVTLSNPVSTAVTVDYAVVEGDDGIPANDDIMEDSGTLTFAPGETSKTITVTPIDDDVAEGVESFTVSLSNLAGSPRPGAVSLGAASATAVIRANDMSTGLSLEGGSAAEGGAVSFTVRRGGPRPLPPISVSWSTAPGSGPGGAAQDDFVASSGTVTVPQDGRVATFTVMTLDDAVAEGEETFTVSLSSPRDTTDPAAVVGLRTATATGRILPSDPARLFLSPAGNVRVNEGGAVEFTARLSNPVQHAVTVEYFLTGFCVLGTASYVQTDGSETLTLCVDEAFPGDLEGGSTTGFEGPDPRTRAGALEFPPGATEQSFSVSIAQDSRTEDDVSFDVRLSASDPALSPHMRDAQGTVTIVDDDPATLSVVPAGGSAGVDEGGSIAFEVRMSGELGRSITAVYPRIIRGTAAAADFMAPALTQLDIPAGVYANDVLATFSVQTTEDSLAEIDETFTVGVAPPGASFALPFDPARQALHGVALQATEVTVRDDDTTTVVSGFADAEAQEGEDITFTVMLEAAHSGADLTLDYAVTVSGDTAAEDDFADFEADSSGTVTFQAGDTEAAITIGTAEDSTAEEDETFTVTLTAPAGVRLDAAAATGTIRNDDAAVVEVRVLDATVTEGEELVLTVELSGARAEDLSLTWCAAVGFQFDGMIFDGTVSIPAGQTSGTFSLGTPPLDGVVGDPAMTVVDVGQCSRFFPSGSLPVPEGVTVADGEATATIVDGDGATVSVDGADTVAEGESITFTVRLTNPHPAPLTVRWAVPAGLADTASTDDFESGSLAGMVAIPANARSMTFAVQTAADVVAENEESFTLALRAPPGGFPDGVRLAPPPPLVQGRPAPVPTATARATIVEPTVRAVAIGDASGSEADGGVTFTVRLSGTAGAPVTVTWEASRESGDTAEDGDFTAESGAVEFPAGATGDDLVRTFTVQTADDSVVEADETFTVTIGATGAEPDRRTVTGTITNDDTAVVAVADGQGSEGGPVAFAATLSATVEDAPVTVRFNVLPRAESLIATADDFAARSGSVTFPAGAEGAQLTQTLNVLTAEDNLVEADETFAIELGAGGGGFPAGVTFASSSIAFGEILNDDSATLSVAPASGPEGGSVALTVTLSNPVAETVTVAWATSLESDDTASAGDFTAAGGDLAFAAGTTDLSQTIEIDAIEDDLVEGDETITVTLDNLRLDPQHVRSVRDVSLDPAGTTAKATIEASDQAMVSIAPASGSEAGNVAFTVTLSGGGALASDVSVGWTAAVAAGDTASEGDFTDRSGTVTFPAGSTANATRTITVNVVDDALAEGDETFTVTLAAAGGGFPGGVSLDPAGASATGTIAASDAATVSVTGGNADEGGDITFTITLSGSPGAEVRVDYGTEPGTGVNAAVQADFMETTGTLTFAMGATGDDLTQTVAVRALDDDLAEGVEAFTMTIGAGGGGFPPGVSLGMPTAAGTIGGSGDDVTVSVLPASAPEEAGNIAFTVAISGSPGADVVVSYATSLEAGDTAAADDFTETSSTLTFASGATGEDLTQTIMVPIADDDLAEGIETFTMTISAGGGGFPAGVTLGAPTQVQGTILASDGATVSIAAAAADEGGDVTFTVTLSGSPGADVVVRYATSLETGDTASADDFTAVDDSLTFAAGTETLMQTFTVATTDDDQAEGEETFTATVSAGGGGFPAGVTLGAPAQVQGTIRADDAATISVSDASGSESGGVTFSVTISGSPGAAVALAWTASAAPDDTATAGDDFDDTVGGMVTFAAGATDLTETFTVQPVDDSLAEGAETFTVALAAETPLPPGVTLAADPLVATGTIEANDAATVSIANAAGPEGGNVVFTVALSGPSATDVMVDYSTAPGTGMNAAAQADFMAMSGALTFAAGATGGDLTQTIEVPAVDDDLTEGDETFTVRLANLSGSPAVTLDPAGMTATGTIQDNDQATVSVASAAADEGDEVAFTVTLSRLAGVELRVDYATSIATGDTAEADDFTLTSSTLVFAATTTDLTQTIRVATAPDMMAEGDETFTVTLTEGGGGFPPGVTLSAATAAGTIRDDDQAVVSVASAAADEGDGVAFTVALSRFAGVELRVDYATSIATGDTASEDDFTMTSGTLVFAATATDLTQTISVATAFDMTIEGDETFTMTLTEGGGGFPPGVTLGGATAAGTIRDDVTALGESRLDRVNDAILPHVAQAMMSSALSAVVGRIETAASRSQAASPPGKSSLLQALKASEHALEDGTLDLKQVLGRSSFALSLNAAGSDGNDSGGGGVAVWGGGDYRSLSSPDDSSVDWDGDAFEFHLGADVQLHPDLVAGLSVARHTGAFDYTVGEAQATVKGEYDTSMTSVHPYASWTPAEGLTLWATVGVGQGEITIKEAVAADPGDLTDLESFVEAVNAVHRSDIQMRMAAAGASRTLLAEDGLIAEGVTAIRLKGEGAVSDLKVEGGGLIRRENYDARRVRVLLEGSHDCRPGSSGGCLSPSVEVGVRHDGGDAESGFGVEVGAGLRYSDPVLGLTIEGRGRALVADEDSREDWGVGGLIRLEPDAAGRGLSFSLAPAFGDAAARAGWLYDHDAGPATQTRADPVGRLETEIGYGFASDDGVVMPYTGMTLASRGAATYRLGGRYAFGSALSLSLEGARQESEAATPNHIVMLRGRLRW